jgi:hypothetical protein
VQQIDLAPRFPSTATQKTRGRPRISLERLRASWLPGFPHIERSPALRFEPIQCRPTQFIQQLEKLLIEPLCASSPPSAPLVLVLDALEQCEDVTSPSSFFIILKHRLSDIRPYLQLFVTPRLCPWRHPSGLSPHFPSHAHFCQGHTALY